MNTHTTAYKAKIRHLCSCLVLCLHLISGAVSGPCEHSVTEDHLLTLRKLIINQVQSGCSINYRFIERQNLSEVCYIKAAFPHILDLLETYFIYEKDSDNYRYTNSLQDLIYNIYSQKCIPSINEEIEENPVKFARLYTSLPQESLQRTEAVFQMFKKIMSKNDNLLNWNCEDEYANNFPESITALHTQPTGIPDCQCSCVHPSKGFTFTESTPTVPSASPNTSSDSYNFRTKSEGFRELETAVKDETLHLTQNPISVNLSVPETFTGLDTTIEPLLEQSSIPVHGENDNFNTSTTPYLMDNSTESSVVLGIGPQSASSLSSTASSGFPSITTRTLPQTEIPQSSVNINTSETSDRNRVLVLAKRSLDTKAQGRQHDKTEIRKNKKVKLLKSIPRGKGNTPADHDDNPPNTQMHLRMAKSLPGPVIKFISKKPDCKDSRCSKGSEGRSRQGSSAGV